MFKLEKRDNQTASWKTMKHLRKNRFETEKEAWDLVATFQWLDDEQPEFRVVRAA